MVYVKTRTPNYIDCLLFIRLSQRFCARGRRKDPGGRLGGCCKTGPESTAYNRQQDTESPLKTITFTSCFDLRSVENQIVDSETPSSEFGWRITKVSVVNRQSPGKPSSPIGLLASRAGIVCQVMTAFKADKLFRICASKRRDRLLPSTYIGTTPATRFQVSMFHLRGQIHSISSIPSSNSRPTPPLITTARLSFRCRFMWNKPSGSKKIGGR